MFSISEKVQSAKCVDATKTRHRVSKDGDCPEAQKMVCYNMQQLVFYYPVLSAVKSFQLSATTFLSFSLSTVLRGER